MQKTVACVGLLVAMAAAGLTGRALGDPPAIQVASFQLGEARVTDIPSANEWFGHDVAGNGETLVVGAPGSDRVNVFVRTGSEWIPQAGVGCEGLTGAGGSADNDFGGSVGLSGDTLVVGAPLDDHAGGFDAGAAFVFARTASVWSQQARLVAGDAAALDRFGFDVALHGDTLVVGAWADDDAGAPGDSGSAYVFVRGGTTWTQQAKLTASDALPGDRFGWSVDVRGDRIVVGAPHDDVAGTDDVGSAYVFGRSGTVWSQHARLSEFGGGTGDHFGHSVAIEPGQVVVGVPDGDTVEGADTGAARVYRESVPGTWFFVTELTRGFGAAAGEAFGQAVDTLGGYVVVGAPRVDGVGTDSGEAYAFTENLGSWSRHPLVPTSLSSGDELGGSIAFSNTRILVGSRLTEQDGRTDAGSVHAFFVGSWNEDVELVSSRREGGRLGRSCDVDGDTAVFGTTFDPLVCVRDGTGWSVQARLAEPDGTDHVVAVDGDTIVVGTARYGSGAPGWATVHVRNGTTWTVQQQLSVAAVGENGFGHSVDVAADTVLVGAPFEDEGGSTNIGAAYVFVRTGTTWGLQQRLALAAGQPQDLLGRAVALDGDTALVGLAFGEAQVFVRTGTTWSEQQTLVLNGPVVFHGTSLDVDGDTIALGVTAETAAPAPPLLYGAAVFVRSGTTWTEQQVLLADEGPVVALDGDRLVTGASLVVWPWIRLYERLGTTWTDRGRILRTGGPTGYFFGSALGIAGDAIVAGDFSVGSCDEGEGYVFRVTGAPSFCDASDGALALCPCGNAGLPDTGCDTPIPAMQGGGTTGGIRLDVVRQQTSPQNRVTVTGTGYPMGSAPAAIVIRAGSLEAVPVVFGDGLRCVGVPLVRLAARSAAGGVSTHTFGHGVTAGPGTFYYQLWFRSAPLSYCDPTEVFNLSNGRVLTW